MAVDPHWAKVVLRQTFDVDFSDASDSNNTFTPAAQVPTIGTPAVFGNALRSSEYAQFIRAVPGNPDFQMGADDFTVEVWVWPRSGVYLSDFGLYDRGGQRSWTLGLSFAGSEEAAVYSYGSVSGAGADLWVLEGFGNIPLEAWTHLCLERSGSTVRVYVNGVLKAKSTTVYGACLAGASPLTVFGRWEYGSASIDANPVSVDDIRITKGVARYGTDLGFAVPTEAYPISGGSGPVVLDPPTGALVINGVVPVLVSGLFITPPTGLLRIEGIAPVLSEFSGVAPQPGALVVEGIAPVIETSLTLDSIPGILVVEGKAPGVFVGVTVAPPIGLLQVEGGTPVLFTVSGTPASQLASMALGVPPVPPARSSQLAAIVLAEPPPPPVRASQAALLAIGEIVPDVLASQVAMLALGHGSSCVTERCQIWKITRRDGVVFRFTSHDRPVTYGREVYKSCRSLNPSASENASTIGSVGNIELMGIIDDEAITEADLYGGLFDDAFVTVDLIVWGAGTEAPRRLAAGWTGSLSQGETGFKMEVLGPGARLEQQALVQMVTPGCRWVFGSTQCGVNADALALVGAVVSARTRGVFKASLPASPAGRQWENGRVRWTSGVNAGQITETKTVDFATGEIVLWAPPGFLPEPGDGFDLIPGCDFNRDGGCTVYANVINFGGFPDLPGADAILETPVAQY